MRFGTPSPETLLSYKERRVHNFGQGGKEWEKEGKERKRARKEGRKENGV